MRKALLIVNGLDKLENCWLYVKYKYFLEYVRYGDCEHLRRTLHGDPPPDPDMDLPWESPQHLWLKLEPFARSSLTTNSLAVSDLLYGLRPAFYSWPHAPHTMDGHLIENLRRSYYTPFGGWYSIFNADVVEYPPYERHGDDPMAQILRVIKRKNPKNELAWPKTLLEEQLVMKNPYVPPGGRSAGSDRAQFNKFEGTVPLLFLPFQQRMDVLGTDETADTWCFAGLFLSSRYSLENGAVQRNKLDCTKSCLPADEGARDAEKAKGKGKGKGYTASGQGSGGGNYGDVRAKGDHKGSTPSGQRILSRVENIINENLGTTIMETFDSNEVIGDVRGRDWERGRSMAELRKILAQMKQHIMDIESALENKRNVAVYCHAGCLRSVTLVGLYLMIKCRVDARTVYLWLKAIRPIINYEVELGGGIKGPCCVVPWSLFAVPKPLVESLLPSPSPLWSQRPLLSHSSSPPLVPKPSVESFPPSGCTPSPHDSTDTINF